MKNFKRIASLVLALTMILCMGVTAFAYTLEINPSPAVDGYVYEAYQIFAGDLSGTTLSNITWGSGVDTDKTIDGNKLLDAVNAISVKINETDTEETAPFASCTSAAEVAAKLSDYPATDNAVVTAFADVVGDYLSATKATSGSFNSTKNNYEIKDLSAGYYLVKNATVPAASDTVPGSSYTRYLLKVVADTTVAHKGSYPTVDKVVTDSSEPSTNDNKDVNEISIGDEIKFDLEKIKVPDMTGYEWYKFVVTDTMSKGITFLGKETSEGVYVEDVTIKIGEKTLVKDTDYTLTKTTNETDGTTTIKIVFTDFIQYADKAGTTIEVSYLAKLNEDTKIDQAEGNKVKLDYSNDPNYTQDHGKDDDDFGSNEPKGETPVSETETYTTKVIINKKDGDNQVLTGAAFRITGDAAYTVVTTGDVYVKYADGEDEISGNVYWKLNDGTYSTDDPKTDDMDTTKYEDINVKYKKVKSAAFNTKTAGVSAEAFVDSTGKIEFAGLGAGEYTISEIVTPNGYNTIPEDITLKITFDETTKTFSYNWSNITDVKDENNNVINEGNSTDIINNAGSTLPETGGIGTTIFYIAGGVLLVGAAVLLITKRRMNING